MRILGVAEEATKAWTEDQMLSESQRNASDTICSNKQSLSVGAFKTVATLTLSGSDL